MPLRCSNEVDFRSGPFRHKKLLAANAPAPDMTIKLETGVTNGNCMAACLSAALEGLTNGFVELRPMHDAAANLRADIVDWSKANWLLPCPLADGQMLHDMFQMAHDTAIPVEEQEKNGGPWPADPKERLQRYLARRVYMCESEQMAFVCMMRERGVNIMLRNWRVVNDDPEKGFIVSTAPDAQAYSKLGIHEFVVIDLEHTGLLDSRSAHYKLLKNASVTTSAYAMKKERYYRLHPDESPHGSTKRRRIVEDSDDDLEG